MRIKILTVDEPRVNGTMYNRENAERILNQFAAKVSDGHVYFGHYPQPEGTETNFLSASHFWEHLVFDGTNLYGELRIGNTTSGRKLQEKISICKDSVRAAVRGYGSKEPNGYVNVYELITIDMEDNVFHFFKGFHQ